MCGGAVQMVHGTMPCVCFPSWLALLGGHSCSPARPPVSHRHPTEEQAGETDTNINLSIN